MNVELRIVKCYEVTTQDGKTVLLRERSTWNGLIDLVDSEGRVYIVSPLPDQFAAELLGKRIVATLISQSPGLPALREAQEVKP